ncbi:hypothetical protein HK100_003624 [Physocladia obscura]|uniref:Uncharacterized protein n=1 Tax=Physocladia obscura TaxID=109957 RepID=A0AAD5T9B1_9FUNG|nr:hypothetical protein HK100_003624 [Physocladia obscura]
MHFTVPIARDDNNSDGYFFQNSNNSKKKGVQKRGGGGSSSNHDEIVDIGSERVKKGVGGLVGKKSSNAGGRGEVKSILDIVYGFLNDERVMASLDLTCLDDDDDDDDDYANNDYADNN